MSNPTSSTATQNDLMGYRPYIDQGDNTLAFWERGVLEGETVTASITRRPGAAEPEYYVAAGLNAGTVEDVRELVALLTEWLRTEVEAKPEIGVVLPESLEDAVAVGAVELLHYVPKGQGDRPALCGDTGAQGWSFNRAQQLQAPSSNTATAVCPDCKTAFDALPSSDVQEVL